MSPDPEDTSDGSPVHRRTYNRLKSPGSSRNGSPVLSTQTKEEAVEEMKKRFLGQSSPSPSPRSTTEVFQRTPTRRSTSRPRTSGSDNQASIRGDPTYDFGYPTVEPLRSLSAKSSASSLRNDTRRNSSHHVSSNSLFNPQSETPDATIDELERLIGTLRRDRTGDAEVESLIGTDPTTILSDLIDLSSPERPVETDFRVPANGPMSRIPVLTRVSGQTPAPREESSTNDNTLLSDFDVSVPPTPALTDFSDTASNSASSGPSTPPSASPPSRNSKDGSVASPKTVYIKEMRRTLEESNTTPTKTKSPVMPSPKPLATDACCARCNLPLFNLKDGGKFVSVPNESRNTGAPPKTYHTACFTCEKCGKFFEERDDGRAVFVKGVDGPCHIEVRLSV